LPEPLAKATTTAMSGPRPPQPGPMVISTVSFIFWSCFFVLFAPAGTVGVSALPPSSHSPLACYRHGGRSSGSKGEVTDWHTKEYDLARPKTRVSSYLLRRKLRLAQTGVFGCHFFYGKCFLHGGSSSVAEGRVRPEVVVLCVGVHCVLMLSTPR